MKTRLFRIVFASILSTSLSLPAVAKTSVAPEPISPAKKAAIQRFFKQVREPEARTYRQMIQALRPFVAPDFLDEQERKLASQLDVRFPKYELKDQGKTYLLVFGSGSQVEKMTIYKDDPKIFARLHGREILHSELSDPWKIMEKIEAAGKHSDKKALYRVLWIEEARAFNYALLGGLGLIGVGIAVGAYFLSKAKTKHEVEVKTPTKYELDIKVPNDVKVDLDLKTEHTINTPDIDKLKSDGKK